jgi:hypothetical protein
MHTALRSREVAPFQLPSTSSPRSGREGSSFIRQVHLSFLRSSLALTTTYTSATFVIFCTLLSSFQKDLFGQLVTYALSVVALALTVMAFCANLALLEYTKRRIKKLMLPQASVKPGPGS